MGADLAFYGRQAGLWYSLIRPPRTWPRSIVGAENLCDQAIFVNHAPGAIAPLDPELIQIRNAGGQLP